MPPATPQTAVCFGSFRMDMAAERLWDGSDPVTLRPKTWQVLRHLVENRDRLVTKHELLDSIWGDVAVEEKAVNTCIGEIRAALGDSSRNPRFIETVQRRGFRFLASLGTEAGAAVQPAGTERSGRGLFVGRSDELNALASTLSGTGGAALTVVSGTAGIGKTRLVGEAVERAGVRCLVGQCIEDAWLPYLPWVEMIREQLRTRASAEWRAGLDTTVAELERLIPGLQPQSAVPLQPSTDPELARIRLFEAIAAFFEAACAAEPLVLVLEDLHWADAASVRALQALLPRLAAVGAHVIATLRDEDAEAGSTVRDAVEALRRRGLVEHVRLRGLQAEESRELVAEIAGDSLPAELVEKIAHSSEGVPFFIEEILRHYDTSLPSDGDPETALPDNVIGMFERRLRRLSPDVRRVVDAIAVAGQECDEPLLEHVLKLPGVELADRIHEAIEQQVLRESVVRAGRYGFVHALMSVAIYQRLTAPRRRALHRDVADAVAATRGDAGKRAAEVARHMMRAIPSVPAERAIDALVEASELAAAGLAYEDAIDHCRAALELAGSAQEEPRARARLAELAVRYAEALQKIGEAEAVARAFREAAEAARNADEPHWLARAALGMATLFEFEAPDVRGHLEEALDRLGQGHPALRARLLARLAVVLYPLPDTRGRCEELTTQAVAEARSVGDPTLLAQTLTDWLAGQWYIDNLAAQERVSEELIEVADRSGDGALLATAHAWRVVIALCSGEIARAQQDAAALDTLARRLGQPLYRWCGLYLLATLALLHGDLAAAEALANQAFELGRPASPQSATIVYFTQMVSIRREQNRIGELLPLLEQNPSRMSSDSLMWNITHFYMEADRVEDAEAAFRRALGLGLDAMPGQNSRNRRLLTIGAMGLTCAALGDTAAAKPLYEVARPEAKRWAVSGFGAVNYGLVANAAGALATCLGRYDDAAEHFEYAIAEYERKGVRVALARALYLYGDMHLRRGRRGDRSRAESLLDRATALTVEHGLVRLGVLIERARSGARRPARA